MVFGEGIAMSMLSSGLHLTLETCNLQTISVVGILLMVETEDVATSQYYQPFKPALLGKYPVA